MANSFKKSALIGVAVAGTIAPAPDIVLVLVRFKLQPALSGHRTNIG